MNAHFTHDLVVQFLGDGRWVKLVQEFGFVDVHGARWPVSVGYESDGATIPRALWSFVGSPFTGKYRQAAVIHDFYCDRRTRKCKDTHRVFYDAMICSGVRTLQAKLMFAAVYFCGPQWTDRVARNNNLPLPDDSTSFELYVRHSRFTEAVMETIDLDGQTVGAFLRTDSWYAKGNDLTLNLKALAIALQQFEPSVEEIVSALDATTRPMEAIFKKEHKLKGCEILNEIDA